ncbi:hypothetical protein OSTOST_14721 [Ostertagia ostertagi]
MDYGGVPEQCLRQQLRNEYRASAESLVAALCHRSSTYRKVVSPVSWLASYTANVNFLNAILSRANQYGVAVGIYTSSYDWSQITGNALINNLALWYWNVYGGGPLNETPANFTDFRSFAKWTAPSVKQFAQMESVCGVTVNRNVYNSSIARSGMDAVAKPGMSQQITVGSLGLASAAAFTGKPEIIA